MWSQVSHSCSVHGSFVFCRLHASVAGDHEVVLRPRVGYYHNNWSCLWYLAVLLEMQEVIVVDGWVKRVEVCLLFVLFLIGCGSMLYLVWSDLVSWCWIHAWLDRWSYGRRTWTCLDNHPTSLSAQFNIGYMTNMICIVGSPENCTYMTRRDVLLCYPMLLAVPSVTSTIFSNLLTNMNALPLSVILCSCGCWHLDET